MKFLISLGHPSQFHLFKNIIQRLTNNGQTVIVLITEKDILKDLLENSNIKYHAILPSRRRKSYFFSVITLFKRLLRLIIILKKTKPDLLLGSESLLPFCGKLLGISSIIFSEDDTKIIPEFARIAYPFADCILSPNACDVGKWKYKKIGYDGYQKLAYLHPNCFIASPEGIESYLKTPFFILRFAHLNAYHDKNKKGINYEIAKRIIDELKKYGNIYITSERALEQEFEKYRININPLQMHSLLSFSRMYIGDSQSMAVEAAILGVPGIRFNDFVGKIGVLNELENKYELATGINPNDPEILFNKIGEILSNENSKTDYKIRQKRLLSEKIDVLAFMVWFLENYPDSHDIMKKNPNYQYNFK